MPEESLIGRHHESLAEARRPEVGSDRSFGLVMGAALLIVAAVFLYSGSAGWGWALSAVGLTFAVLAVAAPRALRPAKMLWFRFGLLLHAVANPVIMAFVFMVAVVPTGLLLRLFGKDVLRLRRDPSAGTYWIDRKSEPQQHSSMKNQF